MTSSETGPSVVWRHVQDRWQAARIVDYLGGSYWLTVEAMADCGWEWLAWSAERPALCRHGLAASAEDARRMVEQAATALANERRG
jgi:hypothetical protein